MNVSDVNPPKITVTTSTQDSLFGDSKGNFKIEGNVIDDDVDNIPQLVLVWIKNADNQKKYVNTEYDGWKKDISATTGDLRFEITLPERDINKTQYYGEFSQDLNIFTDLNIGLGEGKNSLNTQVFALMAKDSGGQTATTFLSFAGDYEKPVLTIDSITVDDGEPEYFNKGRGSGSLLLPPFKRDKDGNIESKVKLSGRWSDDSTDIWEDKTKIGKVTLSWTGLTTPITVTMDPEGNWKTGDITPPDSSTASITATLKDIGNNVATTNECFNININKPELVRLSAKTANGNYKAGKEIELTMEFNKPVQFIGNSDTKPKLKLNLGTENPKYAEYSSGNGDAVHVFKYTVVDGDNTSELDVTGITTAGFTWFDVSDVNTKVENIGIPVVEANQLKGNRDIVIDTKAPTVSSFDEISASGNYNLGKQLYFAVSFSEEVNITGLSKENVQLEFNNGQYSSEVTKTGPSSLLFKYVVTAGHDTSALKAENIVFKNVTVKDNAGNVLSGDKIQVSGGSKVYNIDTEAPDKPVISLLNGEPYLPMARLRLQLLLAPQPGAFRIPHRYPRSVPLLLSPYIPLTAGFLYTHHFPCRSRRRIQNDRVSNPPEIQKKYPHRGEVLPAPVFHFLTSERFQLAVLPVRTACLPELCTQLPSVILLHPPLPLPSMHSYNSNA